MRVDFGVILHDITGKPIINGGEETTLGKVAVNCLLANYADETKLTGEEKLKRAHLAEVAYTKSNADVTAEDMVLLKKIIAKAYGPWVVREAFRLIEGN